MLGPVEGSVSCQPAKYPSPVGGRCARPDDRWRVLRDRQRCRPGPSSGPGQRRAEMRRPDGTGRKRSRLRCGLPDPASAPQMVAPVHFRRMREACFGSLVRDHADRPRIPFFSHRARSGRPGNARPTVHPNLRFFTHPKGARLDTAASRLRPQGRFRWSGPPARRG